MHRQSLSLPNLIEGFRLSCQAEGKSPMTIEWYTCFLNRFKQFLELSTMPTDATQIDKNHIRAFIRYLQVEAKIPRTNKCLSPATVQGYVRTLKSFFSWLDALPRPSRSLTKKTALRSLMVMGKHLSVSSSCTTRWKTSLFG